MDLIHLLIVLIVLAVVMWLINSYIPLTQPLKTIINVVIILIFLLWLLGVFGISTYRIGPVRN